MFLRDENGLGITFKKKAEEILGRDYLGLWGLRAPGS